MSEQSYLIGQCVGSKDAVDISWADGHQSEFNFLWLRDNCKCAQCGDRSVGQKLTSLVDVSPDEHPAALWTDNPTVLSVRWHSDGHLSHYDSRWLREHCYATDSREARRHKPVLWDSTLEPNVAHLTYEHCANSDRGQYEMLSLLRDYGFAWVRGVPCDRESFISMAERVGFVTQTNYGRVSDLVATKEPPRTLSNTKHGIPLHTDECYRHANPGLLAFLCLSASEDGEGATLLADGFNVAERLRDERPDAFEFLSTVSIASHRVHADDTDLRSQSPVIAVDFEGRVQGVRYNERSAAPLDLPKHLIAPAYGALREWLSRTRDPRFAIRLLLRAGDFVIFDNQRVLHGREHFGGNRHLLYCQLDLDEPHSRARVLSRRLGLPPSPLVMHRGT